MMACHTLALLLATVMPGAEISSNGTGGGAWSDPATWRGNKAPSAEDDAIVAKGDTVIFDRDDSEKTTCRKLYLDPQSLLLFQPQAGRIVASIADEIESYGTLRFDASRSAEDHHELRLIAPEAAGRKMRLLKGSGLVISGRAGLGEEVRNVVITAEPLKSLGASEPGATIEVVEGVRIDIQRAAFENVLLSIRGLDNTGARPNERLSVVGSRFTGRGRIMLTTCDTPVVADNSFDALKDPVGYPAIGLSNTTLVDVRKNTIRGRYTMGISGGYPQTDGSLQENTIEGCVTGIYWAGAVAMMKDNLIRDCVTTGLILTSAEGVIEDSRIERCPTALNVAGARVTLTNGVIVPSEKDSKPVLFTSGQLTLLNTNVKPEDVIFSSKVVKLKPPEALVTSLDYVIVGVKGTVPVGTQVDLRTAGSAAPAPGASDPHVRNNPAGLNAGRTPLPQSLNPLIVRSWSYNHAGELIPPFDYTLRILAPAGDEKQERKVLKAMTIKPTVNWFREKPNSLEPTLEVTVP